MLVSRASMGLGDLEGALDDEIRALPAKYRAPLVLCYLEGKTHAEAARLLGWPTGSMSGRIARGLELLRTRLSRPGAVLSLAALMLWLSQESRAAVPGALVESTVRAGMQFAATGACVSQPVAKLVRETLSWPAGVTCWAATLLLGIATLVPCVSGVGWKKETVTATIVPQASRAESRTRLFAALEAQMRKRGVRPPWEEYGCQPAPPAGR